MFFKNLPAGFLSNKQFAKQDEAFQLRCDWADVKPTARQASKFRNGKGSAFRATKPQED